ncbi:MAG: hypothetical protein HRU19_32255 [Pseudobacteriovorax sp.]|nr:hypothetical protein [Pseudobacteriovorax sp.]
MKHIVGFLLMSILVTNSAQAIRVSTPKEGITIFASSRQKQVKYPSKNTVTVGDIKAQELRKVFMVSMGPQYTDLLYQSGSSFTGYIFDDGCRLKNAPKSFDWSYEKALKTYQEQTDLTQKCVYMKVTDSSSRGLRFPRRQVNCNIKRLGSNSAELQGGFCFLNMNLDSYFTLSYHIRTECADPQYVNWNRIPYSEIINFSGFYLAGNASGTSLDLTPIDSVDLRTIYEPTEGPLTLSADLGSFIPRFPVTNHVDAAIGKPHIISGPDDGTVGSTVEIPILFNNSCEKVCKSGLCISPCDFRSPIGAQLTLYEVLPNGQRQFLDLWYAAGVAPGKWQGFIPTSRVLPYPFLRPGGRFQVDISLDYVTMFYNLAVEGFEQFLLDVSHFSSLRPSSVTSPLPVFDPLNGIEGSGSRLPVIQPLPDLSNGRLNIGTGLTKPLITFNQMIKFPEWPPFIEEVCDHDHGNCRTVLDGKAKLNFTLDFGVVEKTEWEKMTLTNTKVIRESNVWGNQTTDDSKLPEVVCE